MRFVRHLLLGLLAIVALLVGAIAFALYDPFSNGPRVLRRSELVTAPREDSRLSAVGEAPIQATDPPALAALALRYQPTVVVSGFDRFWPMSLSAALKARWHGRGPCLIEAGHCRVHDPTVTSLTRPGSRADYLQWPSPLDSIQDNFLSVASRLGVGDSLLPGWPRGISRLDPFASAQVYFYRLPRTTRRSYPGLPGGLISLEYWFFYPLNYFPIIRIPLLALSHPITSTVGNTDYHQGDLEHVAVLLDPRTGQPRYLWMARHADEGQAYRWHSAAVQWNGEHPTIYAALGSHSSYAHCGIQRRTRTYFFINDYVVCLPHLTYGFLPGATPLVDLTHTAWGCWRGHLGEAGRHLLTGMVALAPYETGGPYSPLLQQENFRTTCRLPPGTPKPATAL
ncbi:MAG: hypothetical protein ACR2GZ_07270 [Solirubrobacteraceae bacterium]